MKISLAILFILLLSTNGFCRDSSRNVECAEAKDHLPLQVAEAGTDPCEMFQEQAECNAHACAWYDLSHLPFGGGEKGCFSMATNQPSL